MSTPSIVPSVVLHRGGCHCGRVEWTVRAPPHLTVIDCNCSICRKKQNRHFIVPKSDFTLVRGEDVLTTYTFNTGKAKHTFCSKCGVQSFYTPRSNEDGVGVMPHCIDSDTVIGQSSASFDGRNWETMMETRGGKEIKEMSRETGDS